MALIAPLSTPGGLSTPNGYLKVAEVIPYLAGGERKMQVTVAKYASKVAREDGMEAIMEPDTFIAVPYSIAKTEVELADGTTLQVPSPDPYEQAYTWLKAQDKYPGAVDDL